MILFSYLLLFVFFICNGILFSSCSSSRFEIQDFQQKVRNNPNAADEQFNLGIAYSITKQHTEAVKAFEKAVDLNSSDADAYFMLGQAYYSLSRLQEAAKVFKKAFDIKQIDALNTKLGEAYFIMGQYDNALTKLIKAEQNLEPHPVYIHYLLGMTYYNLNYLEEALDTYSYALKSNHDSAAKTYNLYYFIGMIYGRQRNYKKAIQAYKQALIYRPDYAETYFRLGLMYVMLNDNMSALEQVKKLSNMDNNLANRLTDFINQRNY